MANKTNQTEINTTVFDYLVKLDIGKLREFKSQFDIIYQTKIQEHNKKENLNKFSFGNPTPNSGAFSFSGQSSTGFSFGDSKPSSGFSFGGQPSTGFGFGGQPSSGFSFGSQSSTSFNSPLYSTSIPVTHSNTEDKAARELLLKSIKSINDSISILSQRLDKLETTDDDSDDEKS